MSTSSAPTANEQQQLPARRRRWVRPVIAGAALMIGVGLGGGGTFALWGDSPGVLPSSTIRTGNLDLTLVGNPTWQQTSSDVAGTPFAIDPATFLVRPGDSFRITQSASALLQGDNLNATVIVDFAGQAIPSGVSAIYRVKSGSTVLGSAGVGQPVTIATPLEATNTPVTHPLTIEVDLAFGAAMTRHPNSPGAPNDRVAANLGTIAITLAQVRSGGGFE